MLGDENQETPQDAAVQPARPARKAAVRKPKTAVRSLNKEERLVADAEKLVSDALDSGIPKERIAKILARLSIKMGANWLDGWLRGS